MSTNNDNAALIDALRIAAPNWTIESIDGYCERYTIALPETGASLIMSVGGYRNAGRVSVHGIYPKGYMLPYGDKGVGKITVAISRGADAIVREIQRRYLPGYLEWWANASRRQNEASDYQARKDANLADLAAVLGVEPHGESAYYRRSGGDVCVDIEYVTDRGARLSIDVPLDLARKILALVADASN